MNLLNWIPGRQGTGYRKLCLWLGKSSDCYIIDYPVGSYVPIHTDPVPGKEHHRLNIRICGDTAFVCCLDPENEIHIKLWSIFLKFRPDLIPHMVERVKRRRVVLSVGWVK